MFEYSLFTIDMDCYILYTVTRRETSIKDANPDRSIDPHSSFTRPQKVILKWYNKSVAFCPGQGYDTSHVHCVLLVVAVISAIPPSILCSQWYISSNVYFWFNVNFHVVREITWYSFNLSLLCCCWSGTFISMLWVHWYDNYPWWT